MLKLNQNQKDINSLQRLQSMEQEQYLGYWLKKKGLRREHLLTHPYFDDIILLSRFRESNHRLLDKSERATFNALWGIVVVQKYRLKQKHLKRLEKIHIQAHKRQQHIRHLIKAMRQQPVQKGEQDMTVKGSPDTYENFCE